MAILSQTLPWHAVPPHSRDQAQIARAVMENAWPRNGLADLMGFVLPDLISVIVATYNRPDALDAVLRSLAHQSDADFEVLVADDGSAPQTKELIEAWQPRFNGRLHHVWHPDDGFRLAEIRNRAILV